MSTGDQNDGPMEPLSPNSGTVPPSMEGIRHDQAREAAGSYAEPTAVITGQPWPWEDGWISQPSAGWLPDINAILIVEDRLTDQMIEELTGPVEFVLLASGPMVGLMIRFHGPGGRGSGWEWQEVFSWRHPGDGLPDWADPDNAVPGGHLAFKIIVVDRLTRLVRYQALHTVSPHFTSMLIRE
jgi:hypothetical protein